MGPVMPAAGITEHFTLMVYPGEGSSVLYADAGDGYGPSLRLPVTVTAERLQVGRPEGDWAPPWREVEVVLPSRRFVVDAAFGFEVDIV